MFQSRFIIRLQDLYTNKFQPYFVIESFIFQNVLQKKKKNNKIYNAFVCRPMCSERERYTVEISNGIK